MIKRLYVANLSPETTSDDLNSIFGQVAKVVSVRIPTRRNSSWTLGFGYVEIDTANVTEASSKLNIIELAGRRLWVQEARPKYPSVSPFETVPVP